MSNSAAAYAEIWSEIDLLISKHCEMEPEVAAYMLARASLLHVKSMRGDRAVGEMAAKLAVDFPAV